MKKNILPLLLLILSSNCFAQISGVAFRDYNGNGLMDAGTTETNGLQGVTVTAYNVADVAIATTITGANGFYNFSAAQVGSGVPVRIEFVKPASLTNLSASQTGGAYGSPVQFVNGGATNVNAGFNAPKDYASCTDANLFVPEQWSNTTVGLATKPALKMFSESFTGTTPTPTVIATQGDIGTTWGVATDRAAKIVYVSSFFRKFGSFGPAGQDAIYKISAGSDGNFGTSDDVKSVFIELDTYFGANATGPNVFATNPNGDSSLVGKAAFGDIELSADGTKLYAMNLGDRKIYIIPLNPTGAAPALGTITTSPAIPSSPNCSTGLSRGFGLAVKGDDGKVLVSAVCDNASRNLEIWEYTPSTNAWSTTPAGSLDVIASAGAAQVYSGSSCCATSWTSNGPSYEARWMAMGLDISADGSFLNFSYVRRQIYQGSSDRNLGNIIRFCKSGSNYVHESAGVSCGLTGFSTNNNEGPNGGEFYDDNTVDGVNTSIIGANLIIPGRTTSITTTDDPFSTYEGGVRKLNNTNGSVVSGYLVAPSLIPYPPSIDQFDGKKNNLGDIEFICTAPPIEIGNRVFVDADGDGIQDANEAGLSGVEIELVNDLGVVIGTVTTNATGNYYFSNATGTSGLGVTYGVAISTNTTYTVRVKGTVIGNNTISGNAGLGASNFLTLSNVIGNGQSDWSDNDGVNAGGTYSTTITTGGFGQNNYNVDFGFTVFNTLSTKFISFTATKVIDKNNLTFTIAQAAPTSQFIIERSTNGINFTSIGTLAGTNATTYSFVDIAPINNSKNYYRIKEIDAQGIISYSIIKMLLLTKATKVEVYPMPASSVINITFSDALTNKNVVIKLTNAVGQVIATQKVININGIETIDISSYANGTYQLTIIADNAVVSNRKVVINH